MHSPTYSAKPHKDKSLLSVFVSVGLLFLLFAAIMLFVFKMAGKLEVRDETRAQERAAKLAELRAKEAKLLHENGWVDEKAGIAHITIDRAMELELEALRNKPVRAAAPIQPTDLAPTMITPPPPAPKP